MLGVGGVEKFQKKRSVSSKPQNNPSKVGRMNELIDSDAS
jgi:hypothetical protein